MTMEHNAPQMPLPNLTAVQARVFACLIEKNLATPNSYPLTINSLLLACNQKTNRHPVMALTEGETGKTVNELVELGLAKIDYGERAKKVTHLATRELGISREESAVICMLILREPLTLSEIKARTDKMVSFASVEETESVVQDLLAKTYPHIILIPKSTGRREDRYTHLMSGEVDVEALQEEGALSGSTASKSNVNQEMVQRIEELETRIDLLEEALSKLTDQ